MIIRRDPMNKSKFHLVMIAALIVVLITAFLACGSQATEAAPPAAKAEISYGVYLAPYPQGNVPYGGYHVTIVGFQNKQFTTAMINAVRTNWLIANSGKAEYTFIGHAVEFKKSNNKVNYLGNTYITGYKATFKSPTLTTFADLLRATKHFKGVKSGNWHVTLYTKSLTTAKTNWAILDTNTPWHVYLVERIGKGSTATYHWQLII